MLDLIQEYTKKSAIESLDLDFEDKSVLLKIPGGVGDVLIVAGGAASAIGDRCHLTVAVRPHQVHLTSYVKNLFSVVSLDNLKDPTYEQNFEYSIDFTGYVADLVRLKEGNYYDLAGERLGLPIGPGQLDFVRGDTEKRVCIHPGASNPNRRWAPENWGKVALSFRDAGYRVSWLGTKEEYGFEDTGIDKLSNVDDSLVYQAQVLNNSELFLGNDSGFCHIAGMQGIPGAVVFSSSCPEDVIGKYPLIRAVHVFDRVGPPSRSLNIDDPQSYKALGLIKPLDVLDLFGICESSCIPPEKKAEVQLAYIPSSPLAKYLKPLKKDYVMIKDTSGDSGLPTLYFLDGGAYIKKGDKKYRVSAANHEVLKRGIREVLVQ